MTVTDDSPLAEPTDPSRQPSVETRWTRVCSLDQLIPERGIAARIDRVEAPLSREQRRQPLVEPGEQRRVRQIRYRRIVKCREGGAASQRGRAFGPRQEGEAVPTDRVEQPHLERRQRVARREDLAEVLVDRPEGAGHCSATHSRSQASSGGPRSSRSLARRITVFR